MEGKPINMNRVYITGINAVSALGKTLAENWESLLGGKSGVTEIQHFDTSQIDYHKGAVLSGLREEKGSLIVKLIDLALKPLEPVPAKPYIIWTGVKGNVEKIESERSDLPHLPEHYLDYTAGKLEIEGRGITINAACASSTVGIALAAQKIKSGLEDCVLVLAADLCSRFTHMGFSSLKALSPTSCRPFDENNDGLVLGDGAFALLMCSGAFAREHSLELYSEVAGWGIANDSNHITGPARDGCGLIIAINKALVMAEIEAEKIEAFCAHGTGTRYNDGMELTAIETIFGNRRFPVFSVKGAMGHTMGAAGGIETALCTRALREKVIPPTAALEEPESRARGRISREMQRFGGNNILNSNSGFGGVNAAIVLKSISGKIYEF